MAVTINGDGTITGVSAGGLPDGSVDSDTLATGIDATKLADGTITNSELQYINSLSSNAQTQISGVGGGAILQCISKQYGDRATDSTVTTTGTSGYDWSALGLVITPTATSSHLWIHGSVSFCHHSSYCGMLWVTYNHSAISEQVIASDHATYPCTYRIENTNSTTDLYSPLPISLYVHPNTTNAVTIKFRTAASNANYNTMGLNSTTSGNTDSSDGMTPMSTVSVWEISGDISPSLTNATIDT